MTIVWSALALGVSLCLNAAAYRVPLRMRWLSWVLVVPAAIGIVVSSVALTVAVVHALGGSQVAEVVAVCALMVISLASVVIYEVRR